MLRHKDWMATIAYHIGVVAFLYALFVNTSLFPYAIAMYVVGTFTVSVGYHRLFCHGAFETNRFWHSFFALYGVLFMYSSALQWVVTHATHHKYPDSDKDPHEKPMTMTTMLRKSYRNVPMKTILCRRMLRDPLQLFIDRYYVGIWAVMALAIFAISPEFFVFGYLPAVGMAHFVGACHNTFSHMGDKPRDWWFMEFILPSSGEWLHGSHHNRARSWKFSSKWYHFDLGSLIVRMIKKRAV